MSPSQSSDPAETSQGAVRDRYDVVVVGAGHAGCEAALAAARMGAETALISMDEHGIACMPCNPAIGGIAKSHLVFEIDSLGGEMGKNTDATGIQFRTLNTSRGPAVQAHRVQCDKPAYSARMRAVVLSQENLAFIEGEVADIDVHRHRVSGVLLSDGRRLGAERVIVTSGTFLGGVLHIGEEQTPGGRRGQPASNALAARIRAMGFRIARLKTGTPPRLDHTSLDPAEMELQEGIEPPPFFSWEARAARLFHVEHSGTDVCPWVPGSEQIACYMTHTTPATHGIIADNLERSALYSGNITGTGVRYCPSIEDKIVKFPDKQSHHVFVEPESRVDPLIYPNGTSNSLPRDVQTELIHSIPGLTRARFIEWAYAIEYDFVDPTELYHTLETKRIPGLFFAGQVNGTTGYEEAAAQGFVAGVNAALAIRGEDPFMVSREEGYIGVLVDDLVTKGTDEPYRMFTSRAERRLHLRQDNARFRMRGHAARIGIVSSDFLHETETIEHAVVAERKRLEEDVHDGVSSLALLRRQGVQYHDLPSPRGDLDQETIRQVEITEKYAGYIDIEARMARQAGQLEKEVIPRWVDYTAISQLKTEAREKLERILPRTLGQASRIPGITPADISILSVLIKRGPAED